MVPLAVWRLSGPSTAKPVPPTAGGMLVPAESVSVTLAECDPTVLNVWVTVGPDAVPPSSKVHA